MKEEFTEKEKKQAERLVNQIADDGRFEKELDTIYKKLDAMVNENKEDNAFFFVVRNDGLGKSVCSMGGMRLSLIVALISTCAQDKDFKDVVMEAATFMAQRDLRARLGIKD